MKFEKYKRICIELVNSPRDMENEDDIEDQLNEQLERWTKLMVRKHPNFQYRICNAETAISSESEFMQPMPSSIRFIIHVAFTT